MSSSLRLDLPKTEGATPTDAPLFVAVAVDASGQLFWGDEPVNPQQLQAKVRDSARRNPVERAIFIEHSMAGRDRPALRIGPHRDPLPY